MKCSPAIAYRIVVPLLVSFLLAACGRNSVGTPSRTTPVILISIDTLRSDHLPAYGYKAVETPNIDALRGDSILYAKAYSHVPLTLPSHLSILTGMLPADHGVRDNVGYRLADSIPTIQELLKKNGYATGAAVSAFVLRHETGIARGFDFFDDDVKPMNGENVIGRVQRDGGETLKAARGWLDAQKTRPFFLFVHLYDPHTPYTPPEPYLSRYQNHYDGEIAYADSVVGDLIADLKQKGVYDDALIILLSDHGEGLSEHGEEEHGLLLYREELQIPLIVKLPQQRKKGATVATPVQLVDVFPTILERTATPVPATGHRVGQSLLTFLDGGAVRPIYSETYYPRFHFGWSDLHSLIDGDDHYIRAPAPELYNFASDPGEKKNTIDENRRANVRLRAAIEPFVKEAETPSNIDPEEARKLAALGYVGSTVPTKSGEALPDPKNQMGVFHDIRLAYTYYRNNNEPEALKLTDKLLASNGQLTDLWDLKSKILVKMGDNRAAMEASKEGLRHVPGAISLLFEVANLALTMGDLDTAQQHAEIAVKIEPGQAHDILSRVWERRKDMTKAEAEAKLAVATTHDPTDALMMLSRIERSRGNMQQALVYLDKAVVTNGRSTEKHPGLHGARGDLLARLNRNQEAEQEFRTEIQLNPGVPDAYGSLVVLLATENRLEEAKNLVFEMVKASPRPHTYTVVAETLTAIGDDPGALYWANEGQKKYPQDAELRQLPQHVRAATAQPRRR
ncbi:MAG TPA: sulfatase-like hydrolase/transferase [Thermoanaerobaculia bacterium]|jgi:arylsulfatase A-like enzyme|nr:sulfatase-like hydrolase/transferase [Thermoanaerobaculia bacterium]